MLREPGNQELESHDDCSILASNLMDQSNDFHMIHHVYNSCEYEQNQRSFNQAPLGHDSVDIPDLLRNVDSANHSTFHNSFQAYHATENHPDRASINIPDISFLERFLADDINIRDPTSMFYDDQHYEDSLLNSQSTWKMDHHFSDPIPLMAVTNSHGTQSHCTLSGSLESEKTITATEGSKVISEVSKAQLLDSKYLRLPQSFTSLTTCHDSPFEFFNITHSENSHMYSYGSSISTTPSVSSIATTPSVSEPTTPANPVNQIKRPFEMEELYRLLELKLDKSIIQSQFSESMSTNEESNVLLLPKTPFPSPARSRHSSSLSSRSDGGADRHNRRGSWVSSPGSGHHHPYQRLPRHKRPAHIEAEARRQVKIKDLLDQLRQLLNLYESETKILSESSMLLQRLQDTISDQGRESSQLQAEVIALQESLQSFGRDLDEKDKTPVTLLSERISSYVNECKARRPNFSLFWKLMSEPLLGFVEVSEGNCTDLNELMNLWLEKRLNKVAIRSSVHNGLKDLFAQGLHQ